MIIINASTREKRLIVDAKAAREAYKGGIIYYIIQFQRNFNPSNAMTNAAILPEFVAVLEKNQLHYVI